MKIVDIKALLEAEVVVGGEYLNREVHAACGCDLMSDVLAYVKDQGVLLTGLCNPQSVRTAEMMDMRCIVFVRGKVPSEEMIELAEEREITLLITDKTMFCACGILYSAGLRGGVTH